MSDLIALVFVPTVQMRKLLRCFAVCVPPHSSAWLQQGSLWALSVSHLPAEQPPSSFQPWVLSATFYDLKKKITLPKRNIRNNRGLAKPAY